MEAGFTKVALLAGGVGGARFAEGVSRAVPPGGLTVVANVGDDETFYGLHVSPDIDTLVYTLSDRIDRAQGWGVENDAVRALDVLRALGAPVWMKLGDADLGLHIWRSWRLSEGATLTEITEEAARRLGAAARVVPATDDRLRTGLLTDEGWMDFQPWFVGRRCEPRVRELRYVGAATARPGRAALDALAQADLILLAPSNPLLSVEPILAIPGLREAMAASPAPRVGVSPLIAGKAVKGPLGRLLADLGLPGGAAGAARRYPGLLDGFVIDAQDKADGQAIEADGIAVLATDILMRDPADAGRLAAEVLRFAATLVSRQKAAP